MRVVRGQVQHVAGLEHKLFFGLEVGENLERQVRHEREIVLCGNTPTAFAVGLQQEHVVRIEMRADTAAVGGEADHHVVEPRVGNEAETLHQRFNRRFHEVRALHKHGPVARLA